MPKDYLLFDRYISIQAGTLLLNGLDATFSIEKNMRAEPNNCELKIYNLNEDNRKALGSLETSILVEIKAGYKGMNNQPNTPLDDFTSNLRSSSSFIAPENPDDNFRLFLGDIIQIFSMKEGPDWVTTLRTADGLASVQNSRIDPQLATFKKSATLKDVITTLLKGLRVDTAGAIKRFAQGEIPGALAGVLNSFTMIGAAHSEVEKRLKQLNVTGFIEDNQLIVLKPKETLGTEAVLLSPNTGLLGSPEITTSGLLQCQSLIRPEIRLGHQLRVESGAMSGTYRIERLSYSGSTFDATWYVDIEATPL